MTIEIGNSGYASAEKIQKKKKHVGLYENLENTWEMDGSRATSQVGDNSLKSMKKKTQA